MRSAIHSALLLSVTFGWAHAYAAATPQKAHAPVQTPALRALSTGTVAVPAIKARESKAPAHVVAKATVHVAVPIKIVAATKVTKPAPVLPHRHVAPHRFAGSLSVPLDEVRVVAFSRPVATVYVGNPMIADVSVIDARHAFLLGKGFGHTNIVALDSDGNQVVNDPVNVFGHTGNTVILHRGMAQATLSCGNARCEVAPTPGDDKESFASRMDQFAVHQDAGAKAANAGR